MPAWYCCKCFQLARYKEASPPSIPFHPPTSPQSPLIHFRQFLFPPNKPPNPSTERPLCFYKKCTHLFCQDCMVRSIENDAAEVDPDATESEKDSVIDANVTEEEVGDTEEEEYMEGEEGSSSGDLQTADEDSSVTETDVEETEDYESACEEVQEREEEEEWERAREKQRQRRKRMV